MVRIRRFGVVRTSNIVALWTLVVGLIIFIPVALILAAAGSMTTTDGLGNTYTLDGGATIVGFLIGIIIYAGFLWIFTAIGLLIYNLVAGLTGGVEMELFQPPAPAYVPGPAWGQPSAGGYGAPGGNPPSGYQQPGAYQQPSSYQQPGAYQQPGEYAPSAPPPAPPAGVPPQSYDPAPTTERPSYDPAPRWEPPTTTPRGDDPDRDRS